MTGSTARLGFVLVGALLVPGLQAAEMTHTVSTSQCVSSGTAHATCVSSHSGGTALDIRQLNFNCRLEREGITRAAVSEIFSPLQENGRFVTTLSTPMFGSGSVYCGFNTSRYTNLFGIVTWGQGSAQDCVIYNPSGGSGGGGGPIP